MKIGHCFSFDFLILSLLFLQILMLNDEANFSPYSFLLSSHLFFAYVLYTLPACSEIHTQVLLRAKLRFHRNIYTLLYTSVLINITINPLPPRGQELFLKERGFYIFFLWMMWTQGALIHNEIIKTIKMY